MMIRSILLVSLGLVLVICGGLACTSTSVEPSVPNAHGYTFSLHASDTNLWLGSQTLSDLRPGMAELIVEVRDAQGHRLEGVPVVFHLAPSWVQSAAVLPPHTLTHDGTAHAVFKPYTIGVVPVMAQVNGETQATEITVVTRNIGNSSGK